MEAALLATALAALLAAALVARRALLEALTADRLGLIIPGDRAATGLEGDTRPGWLAGWLGRAGWRGLRAPSLFVAAAAAAALVGLAFGLALWSWGPLPELVRTLEDFPGGVGRAFIPFGSALPVVLALLAAAAPWLVVRARRRFYVESVEQDLPITLDLFATLAEAGFGFDAALAQVLESAVEGDRPLARELRLFQLELRTGRPRVECFQRLRERMQVPAMDILVSALVSAEHLGASTAEVLRIQAVDLRVRRRERALARAQTLPLKLIFPLFFCFLPGLFVITLGPTLYQLFQLADQVIRGGR